jgi:4'-phosphopantetheinyl transferase
MLDPDERRRVTASYGHGRTRRLAGFVLLRCSVAFLLGGAPREVSLRRHCPHCPAPHGRPEVVGSPVQVSVSHAAERVAVAVSTRDAVGVDVEAPKPRALSPALLRRALTAAERQHVLGLPAAGRTAEFLRAWTAKEAILKATGDGLHGGLDRLELDLGTTPVRLRSWAGSPGRAGAVRLLELDPGDDHIATLATIGGGTVVPTHHEGRALVERMMG